MQETIIFVSNMYKKKPLFFRCVTPTSQQILVFSTSPSFQCAVCWVWPLGKCCTSESTSNPRSSSNNYRRNFFQMQRQAKTKRPACHPKKTQLAKLKRQFSYFAGLKPSLLCVMCAKCEKPNIPFSSFTFISVGISDDK